MPLSPISRHSDMWRGITLNMGFANDHESVSTTGPEHSQTREHTPPHTPTCDWPASDPDRYQRAWENVLNSGSRNVLGSLGTVHASRRRRRWADGCLRSWCTASVVGSAACFLWPIWQRLPRSVTGRCQSARRPAHCGGPGLACPGRCTDTDDGRAVGGIGLGSQFHVEVYTNRHDNSPGGLNDGARQPEGLDTVR